MAVPNSYGNIFSYSRTKTQAGTAQTPNATPKTFNNIFNYQRATDNTRLQTALDSVGLAALTGSTTQSAIIGTYTAAGKNEITNWNNPELEAASVSNFIPGAAALSYDLVMTTRTASDAAGNIIIDPATGRAVIESVPSIDPNDPANAAYFTAVAGKGIYTPGGGANDLLNGYVPFIDGLED